VRPVFRTALSFVLAALLLVPVAQAAGPTPTTAAPTVSTTPQPAPGSAFSPLQGIDSGAPTPQTTTVTPTKRAGDTGSGRSTLLFLSLVALVMIAAVGVFIWHEGRKTRSARRRRRRMRSARTPQPVTAASGARRGPPPPPRKRRAQAAKRRKR
jgi:uncharacterized protein HemX